MSINYTTSYTFSPGTTISSSQVNTNFSDNTNTWVGLEALTKSFSGLRVDATPTTATDVSIKSYVDKLNAYRRPILQYASGTVVNIETGLTGTSGQAAILFPDGNYRTDSTAGRINCNLAQVAALSGSWQSGLRTGSVSNNTWYAIYAVKTTDDTSKFVAVADTTLPTQASFASLNSNFGTNGWVYLGMIAYGDNSGTANAILSFVQCVNFTKFRNTCVANGTQHTGIRLATQSVAATPLVYTYASGTAISSAQIPAHLPMGYIAAGGNNAAQETLQISATAATILYAALQSPSGGSTMQTTAIMPLSDGVTVSGSASNKHDIFLSGYWDAVLGVGASPIL